MPVSAHSSPASMPTGGGVGTIGPLQLFVAFSRLALSGFGGVLPFAYRALVERRKWLDAREFASLLAIAQVLPGPTICNLSVMIGQRYAGFAGACAALGGMVLGPSCVVVALGIAWQRYGEFPAVKHALAGMSAVAIGLIFATAVKMGIALFRPDRSVDEGDDDRLDRARDDAPGRGPPGAARTDAAAAIRAYWSTQRIGQVALCVAGFVGVGLLRWPLVAVVAGLAPFAIALAYRFDPER